MEFYFTKPKAFHLGRYVIPVGDFGQLVALKQPLHFRKIAIGHIQCLLVNIHIIIMTMGNTFLIVILSLIVRTHIITPRLRDRFTNSHNEAKWLHSLVPRGRGYVNTVPQVATAIVIKVLLTVIPSPYLSAASPMSGPLLFITESLSLSKQ